jgi:hypothetical protein
VDSGDTVYSGASGADAYVTGQLVTVGTGTLTAALDGGTPLTQLVQGNQTVTTAKFKFTATNDTYTIEELKTQVASGAEKLAGSVELYDGSTLLGSQPIDSTSRQSHFTGLTVSVPAGTTKVLTVKLVLGEVSADGYGTNTGVDLKTSLVADSVKYKSASTGDSLTDQPAAIVNANSIYAYKAVPTVALSDLTNSSVTNGAAKDLYAFTVTAPAAGNVGLYKFTLGLAWSTSTVTAPSLGTFELYKGSTPLTSTGIATTTVSTATEGVTSIVWTFPAGETVAAGSSVTYKFRATPAGFDPTLSATAADVLTLSLTEDTSHVSSAAAGSVSGNFVWSDSSYTGHATTTADWANSYLVEDMPIGTESWSR